MQENRTSGTGRGVETGQWQDEEIEHHQSETSETEMPHLLLPRLIPTPHLEKADIERERKRLVEIVWSGVQSNRSRHQHI